LQAVEELAATVARMEVLDELNLAACHLGSKALLALCDMLKRCASLTK
jgi:hypothetical protein